MLVTLPYDRNATAAGAAATTPKKGDILSYGEREGVYLGWTYLDSYAVREDGSDEILFYAATFVTHWTSADGTYRPRITPRNSTHKIIADVTRAISMGRTVRLGRWRALYDSFSDLIEIEFGDDTQEVRAGAEPAGGWWTETCREWPGEAAEAIVKFWLADNGVTQ